MRYLILQPRDKTFDPRFVELKSTAHLHELMPPLADCATEREAVSCARRVYPNALAMPFTVKVGSGIIVLLGFVEHANEEVDPDDVIPFVMIVQPIGQTDGDRAILRRAADGREPVFDRKAWRLKPVQPAVYKTLPIEWRTTELDVPAHLDAHVGYENGRLVIYAEMGEHALSIALQSDRYELVERRTEHREPAPPTSETLRIV